MRLPRDIELCTHIVTLLLLTALQGVQVALADPSPLVRPDAPALADGALDTEDLVRRGARIGQIHVRIDDVFEQESDLAAPYRLANSLHIATHEQTILQQLLFRTGDVYDTRVVGESERLLRAQRYLNDATITPLHYNDDNTVDVLVRVHDVWTLSPGISFGRKGGENSAGLKFEDANFLGLGKQIAAARTSDVDRDAWRLGYIDPNVLGTRWRLSAAYSSTSDGDERLLAFGRPFYSLDSRWSTNLALADTTSAVPRYSYGELVEEIGMRERSFELGGGISSGLSNGRATRYLAGFTYDSRRFSPVSDYSTATLPEDRVLAYPWVGVEIIEDSYVNTRNLDQIGRIEDLHLGRAARLQAGFASTLLGATRDALVLSGSAQSGMDFGSKQYWLNNVNFDGRLEEGDLIDARLEVGSRYYFRHSPRRVSFAAVTGTLTRELDPEEQLLLGGDSGLRGYPLRYQAGTANALLTLEERFYTNWQPLKLVNVGAAVFMDAGRAWGHDPYSDPPAGWLCDVGFGLRLGSIRSGLGNVLHIDLAFPLNAPDGIDAVQLLVETRKSF